MQAGKLFLLKVLFACVLPVMIPSFLLAATQQKNDLSGFCCADGIVQKATVEHCYVIKGRYYQSSTSARQSCRPENIFCCINGRINELPVDDCIRQKGNVYKSVADAEKRCKSVARKKPLPPVKQTVSPDLLISRFSISPKQVKSGDKVKLTVQIKNVGKHSLKNVTVKFYNLEGNKLLGEKVVTIAAGASKYSTITVPLIGKGRKKITAIVDPDRKIKESNEKNNKKNAVVTVTKPVLSKAAVALGTLPDIIPLKLELDRAAVAVNELITIRATIKMFGLKSLQKAIPVEFLIDDTVIGTKRIRVPVNSTRSVSVDYTVKRAGRHVFSVIIDPKNSIAERNEKNNSRAIRLGVTPQPAPRHVPGQIILLVDNNKQGNELLQELIVGYDLEIKRQQTLISLQRIMAVCVTKKDVRLLNNQLRKEKGLYGSQPNFIFSTMSGDDPLRSMQSIDALVDLDTIHQKSSGKNVLVAIIDTGVDVNHKDLQGRVAVHSNFIEDSAYQGEIHGTAVAGIIAAARNDFGIIGIAPDANLLAYRACKQRSKGKPEGECYSTSIAAALDAAIVAKARIANLSIGSEKTDTLISALITEGSRRGMQFVAPVGNSRHTLTVRFPASHPKVIAVAGFDEMNKPVPNKHLIQSADATAPSENIFSSVPGDHHNFVNGTSFSTATITGLMALALEDETDNKSKKLPSSNKAALWRDQFSAYIDL